MIFKLLHFAISLIQFFQSEIFLAKFPGRIDGNLALKGQFPWHVTLKSNMGVNCDGALISSKWVVTAASCVARARNVDVSLGTLNFFDQKIIMKSYKIETHPEFSPSNLFRKDIALVQLKTDVKFTKEIKPISLPKREIKMESLYGKNFNISGYGYNSKTKRYTKLLRSINLRILSDDECNNLFWKDAADGAFCTQLVNPKENQCFGDYGSPLIRVEKKNTYLVGVLSTILGECQNGHTGFQSIHSNLPWISKITGIKA